MTVSPDKVRKIVTFDRAMWSKVEDYRFENRIQTEAEAIRRLVEIALKVEAK